MGIQYDGKSPGKLWYFWQTTKALVQTPFNHTTRKDAGRFGLETGKTVGVLAVGNLALMIPVVAATPILPWIVGGVALTLGFQWGKEAWKNFKGLKETAFVTNYVRTQETKWYERKKAGNVFTRVKNSIKGAFAKIPSGVIKAAKWLGIAGAVTGLAGATVGLLGQFAAIPALAPVMTAIVSTGAAIGLTAGVAVGVAIGAAALAIPVGLGVFVASRNALAARDPEASPFKFKKPAPDAKPIEQGKVFEGRSQSFDFNDNAPPQPVKAADDDAIAIARRKAAEERAKNKGRRDNSKKF